jgi:DsbC/DsbD-like thiol-disulfide interchange protein
MSRSSLQRAGAGLLALALPALIGPTSAVAQAKKSDAVVKVAASADKPGADGKQVVTVTMTINKGWYIYANPVGLEDLASNKTVVTVGAKQKLASVKVDYPTPVVKKDKTLGDYKIYQDKAVIKATVQRARGDTSPLQVTVDFMSCDGSRCLLPAKVKISVP